MEYEKLYKESLERAKKLQQTCDSTAVVGWCEYIFPELKESEDEKVRKALIEFVHDSTRDELWAYHISEEEAIAWLEKQGEQKPNPYTGTSFEYNGHNWGMCARDNGVDILLDKQLFKHLEKQGEQEPTDKVEPKFKAGDWVVTSYGKVNQVIAVDEDGDGFTLDDDTYFSGSWKDGYHLWTIQDAKDGDVLVASDGSLFIFAKLKDNSAYYHFSLCKNGSKEISDGKHAWETANSCYPATESQRDTLMKAMADAGYTFDFEKKELKKIEKESSWSEEDETKMRAALAFIKSEFPKEGNEEIMEDTIEWLKSLRPQKQWKPSDEQLYYLYWIANIKLGDSVVEQEVSKHLNELYNDLKKL